MQSSSSSSYDDCSCEADAVHDDDLWFDDGNLVLQARNRRFRISRGILAARSPVFREMLTLPQPCNESLVDGCPLVQLYDAPEDVAYFLRAIYDSSFFEPPPTRTDVEVIAGVLRLSTKYEVDYLRHRAIRHLDSLYPLTLEAFDKRQDTRTTPWKDNTAFFVSLVAREMNVPWILPSVLYCVCSCPVQEIMDGFKWNEEMLYMNKDDQRSCLKALIPLTNREHRDLLGFLTVTDVDGCEMPSRCCIGKLTMLRNLEHTRDMLHPLDCFVDYWAEYATVVCAACFAESKALHTAARDALWNLLPETFGLPDWDVLAQLKREALAKS